MGRRNHSYDDVQAKIKHHKAAAVYISAGDVPTALYTIDEADESEKRSEHSDSSEEYDLADLLHVTNNAALANILANTSFVQSSTYF